MTFADLRTCSMTFLLFISTAILTLGTTAAGRAQTNASTPKDPRIGELIDTRGKTNTPSSAAISTDATALAWGVGVRGGSQIHLTDVANPDPAKEKIVGTGSGATSCGSSEPKWSPDGQWLAFGSDCTSSTVKHSAQQISVLSKKLAEE